MADNEQSAPTIQINISIGADGTPTLQGARGAPAPKIDLAAPDSPAWNPDAHDIGHQWATHPSRANDTNPDRRSELRQIYHNLFTKNVDLGSDKVPFQEIQSLQRMVAHIDQHNPAKTLTAEHGFTDREKKLVTGVTVVDAINDWLAPLNGGKKASLTFSQYVLLWHIFFNQDDIKLLSPWEVPSATTPGLKPW